MQPNNPSYPVTTPRQGAYITLRILLVVGVVAAVFGAFLGIGVPAALGTDAVLVALAVGVALNTLVLAALLFNLRAGGAGPAKVVLSRGRHREESIVTPDGPPSTGARADASLPRSAPEADARGTAEPIVAFGSRTTGEVYAFSDATPDKHPEEGQHVTLIEGIGPVIASRLGMQGIVTIPQLLRLDAAAVGGMVGVTEDHAATLQAQGRLMRLHGIGPQYAELLAGAGVRSVEGLAGEDADSLLARIKAAQEGRKLRIQGGRVGKGTVQRWIEAAQDALPEVQTAPVEPGPAAEAPAPPQTADPDAVWEPVADDAEGRDDLDAWARS